MYHPTVKDITEDELALVSYFANRCETKGEAVDKAILLTTKCMAELYLGAVAEDIKQISEAVDDLKAQGVSLGHSFMPPEE